MPALLTTMSTSPNASTVESIEVLRGIEVGDVVAVGDRPAAGRDDLGDHRLGRRESLAAVAGTVLRPAGVVHDDRCTLAREQQRVGPAEATTRHP